MFELITRCTNLEVARVKENWRDVDENEMLAFVGLMILQGVYKSAGEATEGLWSADSRKIFSDTMTYHCFVDILRFLSFDDKATRNRRREQDKLCPIRESWDSFKHNTTGAMVPDKFLTIHERRAPFNGRCSFIQYMSAKPENYGIKMWLCWDAETRYIYNAQVYMGKENAADPRAKNLASQTGRANRVHVPREFVQLNNRDLYSSIFDFTTVEEE